MTRDLFGDTEAAKVEGMSRVEDNANESWKRAVMRAVVAVARESRQFTTDEVFDYLDAMFPDVGTHELRAMGPIMLTMAKEGICRKSNGPWRKTRRRSRHAAPLQVWDSLIFGRS